MVLRLLLRTSNEHIETVSAAARWIPRPARENAGLRDDAATLIRSLYLLSRAACGWNDSIHSQVFDHLTVMIHRVSDAERCPA